MAALRRYAPSFITVRRLPKLIELLGLLFALLGLTIRIDPPIDPPVDGPVFCPPREKRVKLVPNRFEASSSNISTVVYPPILLLVLSQLSVDIIVLCLKI